VERLEEDRQRKMLQGQFEAAQHLGYLQQQTQAQTANEVAIQQMQQMQAQQAKEMQQHQLAMGLTGQPFKEPIPEPESIVRIEQFDDWEIRQFDDEKGGIILHLHQGDTTAGFRNSYFTLNSLGKCRYCNEACPKGVRFRAKCLPLTFT
jgi:hypothetical protein